MKEVIDIILKKQCELVGADFIKTDFKKPYWYWQHEWSREKENEFKKWFVDYFVKNKKQFRMISERLFINKKVLSKAADEWCMQFGWKIKTN